MMIKMKIIKKVTIIATLMIMILGGLIFPNVSNATGKTTTLYATHRYGNLLERNGVDLTCIYIVHNQNGIEYPAYCLNLELDGATEDFSYDVNIDNQLTNMEIWRTVVNGYPYKTPEELGCETKEEAYLATRQAIYCSVYGRDPNSYHALGGAAGERTLNALKQIVNTARTSTETKPSATLNINASDSLWKVDEKDKNYVSKEFTVTASAGIENYKISLTGELIEGMKITDINNKEKSEFVDDEKFKILIPIKNLTEEGTINIEVEAKVNTKPVLYGKAPNSSYQDYALTAATYEDGSGNTKDEYNKNETKIIILKKDEEDGKTLQGVEFQLLNENKEPIYVDLKTNEEGKIVINNLVPGTYYIKETKTIDGYEIYDELIEVKVQMNQELTVTINNKKQEKPKIETKEYGYKEVKKLPVTGM